MKKSAYVILRHQRHLFGVKTLPIMVFSDLVAARMELDLMKGFLKGSSFTIAVTPIVQ